MRGSKELYHNARRSRAIKQRLRADPSLLLDRADHRHLKRTRTDLLGGFVIVLAFWIPVVGNVIPLLAHFFPRQLPSVFVTQERKYELICEDVKEGLPILLELQSRIDALQSSPPSSATEELKQATAHLSTPPAALTSPSLTPFALTEGRQLRALVEHRALFDALPLPSFPGRHLYRLLQYHANLLVLHALLPSAVLVRHLHDWAESIHHDDALLLKEGRAHELTVRELSEALHERGLYCALMSDAYRAYIEGHRMKKRGERPDDVQGLTAADEEESAAHCALLKELEEWLELRKTATQAGLELSDSLLSHAGPVSFTDHHLTGVSAQRRDRRAIT